MKSGYCRLCKEEKQLQLSHIIPKFVFSWHKRNSPSFLRDGQEPNKRIQDGEKKHLFCAECEQLFSSWEDKFAREAFSVLNDPNQKNPLVRYGEWALKFATSISYRVATFSEEMGDLSHFPNTLKNETNKAMDVWRRFLLGEIEHPGKYEQHLMHLDVIKSHNWPDLSDFMSRYFVGAVHNDMVCSNDTAFTYAKMFRVVIFGHITELKNKWQGTRISPKSGLFGQQGDIAIPEYVLNYMNNKANEFLASGNRLSNRQQEAITKNVNANSSLLIKTSMFKALMADHSHRRIKNNDKK